ncbi:hypothetical protein IV487_00725 [Enterococcus saccharolyticus]|uniref:hypothetical protein n=1 Tax=Enterococcus TaxID=1350 RepID=UPI001E5DB776|nr:hypothetical protein [Enterococcus saccharolyticus]MCD5000999.1 hypothetical protein [Enterococcus saccharolyticus]
MKIPPNLPVFHAQHPTTKPDVQSLDKKETSTIEKPINKKAPSLADDSRRWAEDIRLHHPEKYTEWVARNKEKTLSGYPDLSPLPHGFSIRDYYAAQNPPKE